ncbi:hypothetical protein [Rhodospirillum rubrum]|uniref:Uncharacterized protein n=1 Tax=Rhodospirillum rubrum (strain ATCC 11170 / ATH 1.1.1 / DSM 467 / LMG 4362 / NCIMB 8255 / S1) TaxID=269796 RepID=Q2RQZ8_RHORT|nr:hypothetical protein [Rhodospirillum rubrum]ABC23447.1 hypothetical protein Rru_A2650 [Rhodospirillum rubrum ATCC 11170]MBK1666133.1 hypothetical protein [Rhodospirillum rubrum]MBK1676523.1 hypothetical protein [Rhodospirillum rubrum]MBK5955117.1 hypothetical protein [Rhodospirillum rubrum]QXG79418.1 hypothetical protein KUL73_13670 [Rhodospirillum rubrum]
MSGNGTTGGALTRPQGTRFSIAVYNATVRALTQDRVVHGQFDAHWADIQHQEVIAEDAAQARRLAARIFPPADGFVITEVKPLVEAA